MAILRPGGREAFWKELEVLMVIVILDSVWLGTLTLFIFYSLEEKASDGRITSSMRVLNKFIDYSGLFGPPLIREKYTCATYRAITWIDSFLLSKN